MTDMPSTALTINSRPRRRWRLMTLAVLLLFLMSGLLATVCSYRWLVILPQGKIAVLTAQQAQIATLNNRLQRLENVPAPTAQAATGAASADDLARLETEVTSLSGAQASLQGELKRISDAQAVSDAKLSEAIIYIRLDSAVRAGQSFAPQLAALRAAAVEQPEVETLLSAFDPYATTGAPTISALQQEWTTLAPRIAHVSDEATAQGWLDRIKAELKMLVSIHSLNDHQPDAIAAITTALAQGDAAAALTALQALPAEAQTAAAAFGKHLAARQAIDQALAGLATSLTTSPLPPSSATHPAKP